MTNLFHIDIVLKDYYYYFSKILEAYIYTYLRIISTVDMFSSGIVHMPLAHKGVNATSLILQIVD